MSATEAPTLAARGERILGRISRRLGAERGVSFPELVWAHHLRQKELRDRHHEPYRGPAEHRFRDFEERFEARNGPIVNAYWCSDEASAVALTIKRRPLLLPDRVRLHWATDWTTKDMPKLMTALYRCESLSVRVQEVLRDTSLRLAMQSLFTAISFLLGFAETERARNERAVAEIEHATNLQLAKIERYYRRAALRSGQIVYVGGMLLGMVPMAALAVVAWLLKIVDLGNPAARLGLFCFAAGGVGALISVMARMNSGKVRVDWEFGKDTLRTLGALRPFVGAVFGLMTYFALKSGVVALDVGDGKQTAYFFVLFSFAAGFSERLAQDMLLGSTLESAVARGRRRRRAEEEEAPALDELGPAPEPTP
jgi:hypothetical protein